MVIVSNGTPSITAFFPGKNRVSSTAKNSLTHKKTLRQTYLNLSTGKTRLQTCSKCNLVYQPGVAEDEKLHIRYHKQQAKMQHLKADSVKELIVKEDAAGQILRVNLSTYNKNKVHLSH